MKKILLHIILFSYAIVMFKPAFPYLQDFVGHVLFYKQHMATMHFENGEYHVHAQVIKNAKEDNSNKSPSTSKKENRANDHVVILNKLSTFITAMLCRHYSLPEIAKIAAGNGERNDPPPRI